MSASLVDQHTGEVVADGATTFVPVANIIIGERHRTDLGDIEGLAASIADVGLMNPITITWDYDLIAGERRLAAVRLLGWEQVQVTVATNLRDAAAELRAERDENTCRKDMLPSELIAEGNTIRSVEEQAARNRQGTRSDLTSSSVAEEVADDAPRGTTDKVVGDALGIGESAYFRGNYVAKTIANETLPDEVRDAARDAMRRLDAGEIGWSGAYRVARNAVRATEGDPPINSEGRSTDNAKSKRPHKPATERLDEIRDLADSGHVADQIATKLGTSGQHVRNLAREADITLPEAAIGRQRKADPNRIIRETVAAAEGAAFGLDLIAYEELDRSQIEEWTSSLSNSIRALNRLKNQLKELAA